MQHKKNPGRRRRHAREARKREARLRQARQYEDRSGQGLVRGLLFRALDRVRTWFDDAASRLGYGDEGPRGQGQQQRQQQRGRGRGGPRSRDRNPYPLSFSPMTHTWPWSWPMSARHSPYMAGPEYYYQQMLPPGVRGRPMSRPGRHTGRGPRGYTRPDVRIVEDINEALTYSPHIDASDIDVRVDHGEVTVSGTVDDRYIKRLVENIIEDVSGVRDVHNNLRVERREQHTAGGRASSREDTREVRGNVTLSQDAETIEASVLNASKERARKDQGGFSGT